MLWTLSCGEIVPYYMWVELCRRWVHDDFFFFLYVFPSNLIFILWFWWVWEEGFDCAHLFNKTGVSQDKIRFSHQVHFTFTFLFSFCSYFGNALIQHCYFMKSLYDYKTAAKKHFNKKCFIACLLCKFKTIKKQPSETSWSTWKNIHNNYIHSNKVLWALLYIWNNCHQPTIWIYVMNLTVILFSFFFFSFFHFCHLWSIVELKIFLLNYFLKAKLKQYPFRDSISCIMKHQWCVHYSILSPFQL